MLVVVGIKPIKIKLQKSIKFSTLHPFAVSECCMFSLSYVPKQQSHLLSDLCKLKQVWSSNFRAVTPFTCEIVYSSNSHSVASEFVVNSCRPLIYTMNITKIVGESQMDKHDKRWEKEAGKAPGAQDFCA